MMRMLSGRKRIHSSQRNTNNLSYFISLIKPSKIQLVASCLGYQNSFQGIDDYPHIDAGYNQIYFRRSYMQIMGRCGTVGIT